MDLTKEQRAGIVESLQEVRAALMKIEKDQKDLNEKLGKLKTKASVQGSSPQSIVDETLKVLGAEVEKVGFGEG